MMYEKKILIPYGSWKSPITSDLASSPSELSEITLDGLQLYWRELRPEEEGRYTIMRREPDGQLTEVVASPFNARTLVHEYGGGTFVVADGTVYFSNFADQRIYRKGSDVVPVPITPETAMRYADGVIDRERGRLICVREDHTVTSGEPVNTIVSIDTEGHEGVDVLVSGNDFYSSPRLSPNGSHLTWLTWNHPNMPWDGTELWVGEFRTNGSLGGSEQVAGGVEESIMQPEWSPDGILHFVSDRNGWWNIYRWHKKRTEAVCKKTVEFARPHWTFGLSSFAFESAQRIVCAYSSQGYWQLAELDTASGDLRPIEKSYSEFSYVRAGHGRAVFVAGSQTMERSIVQLDFASGEIKPVYPPRDFVIDSGYLSMPRPIEFSTSNGFVARGFFYAPRNRDFCAQPNELPPLIVIAHGGPTNSTQATLDLAVQYWTSRGFAVFDVNYRGSTGYGRAYREQLYGQWGLADVDDCVNGALYLVERGEVDGDRLVIRGRSAGGYTTLCALTFRNAFKAGTSYYGISDLEVFDKTTHKFESQYNRKLIGPYPEKRDLYRQRSSIHFIDRISSPILLLQGLEDEIVPPEQAELIVKALRKKRSPFAYIPFQEEQHGFRHKENIKRALEAELYFYSKIFGLNSPDSIPSIKIEHLDWSKPSKRLSGPQ